MIRAWARRIEAEHLAWNVATVAPYVPPGARVLDVGSWDCKLGAALRDRGARVTCVDVVDKNRTDVELRLMRGATLPVTGDERFDVVQFLYVLHHAADDLALLREARRVVADDGRVLVAEDRVETWGERWLTIAFHLWLLAFTFMGWKGTFKRQSAWRARFAQAGLTVERTVELGRSRRLFPKNVLYVLAPTPASPARPNGRPA